MGSEGNACLLYTWSGGMTGSTDLAPLFRYLAAVATPATATETLTLYLTGDNNTAS